MKRAIVILISNNDIVSALSISKIDNSTSVISNHDIISKHEIWSVNLKKEDSTVFLEEIEKLKKGKKKKKTNENTANEEDYDDEILDENVSSVKTEQIQHISGNVDFNQNNLYQLSKKPNSISPTNNVKTNETSPSNSANVNNKPIPNEDPLKDKCFTQIVLNGIESGKYYTPKSNKVISKYDTVNPPLSNSTQYNRIQRDLNFVPPTNAPLIFNGNPIIPTNLNANGAFMMSNVPPANRKFQSNKFMFVPGSGFQGNGAKPPFTEKNKNSNKSNSKNKNGNNDSSTAHLSKKIIIDDILIGKEKRTTLMLRNIPNKYSLINVVEEINSSFWGKYDYINLPIDYERKLNLGYAFINFVDPMHIIIFYETYHNKKWSKYRSDKKMDMTYADKQGKKDINCRDEQTYFAVEDKRFNFNTLVPKLEIPICHLDFFKKIYPNSVCVVEDKHGIYSDKCFVVKSIGKK